MPSEVNAMRDSVLREIADNAVGVNEHSQGHSNYLNNTNGKSHKILISHASQDQAYMDLFVELLEKLRLPTDAIICSSVPGYGIPGGRKIYEWLREQFMECDLHVIFVLSDNYYASPACLNEMGAAWVTKSSSTLFLLPGFRFEDIKGCIDHTQVGISFDSSDGELKHRLNELREDLIEEYSLDANPDIRWERARDRFIQQVRELGKKRAEEIKKTDAYTNIETVAYHNAKGMPDNIPVDSSFLIVYAASDGGEIIKSSTFEGTQITAANYDFVRSVSPREAAKWEGALDYLLRWDWVKTAGRKGEFFKVTGTGYDVADMLRDGMQIDITQDPIEQMKEFEP